MKRIMERIFGPLGPFRRLRSGPQDEGETSWGWVPEDQEKAKRYFWKLFGFIMGANALLLLVFLAFKVW